MKVSCLQENLTKGLGIVGRAVATRSTLPVLSNILLSTDGSRLKLAATNLEVGINCWVGAKVELEGAITVPARLLSDFVNSLPAERIDLELDNRTRSLNLSCGRYTANIKGIDAQEFPIILTPEEDHRIRLDPDLLRRMIDQVAFTAASDESRPVLTGVLIEADTNQLTFAAADGYRLSVRSVDLERGPEQPTKVIVPARALQELRRISGELQDPIEMVIAADRNQVFFHLENIDLVSQLIEGAFPDFRRVIPTSHNTRVTINSDDFGKAVRMAFIFARDAANVVRLQVVSNGEDEIGKLIVSATSSEHGDSISELECTVEGDSLEVGFNARYFIEALNIVDAAQVTLAMRDANSSAVLRMVGGDDYVHVIMPMHLPR